MDLNYQEILDCTIAYAKENKVELDFSMQSLDAVDYILECYHKNLSQYEGKEDALASVALHYGIYIGETMLRLGLKKKGYEWNFDGELPILRNQQDMELYPVTKAYKRIVNGLEDSITGFCVVAMAMMNESSPENPVNEILEEEKMRPIKLSLDSGKSIEKAHYLTAISYLMHVREGKEDFIILDSNDGFFQFYGYKDQYVAEVRINLPDDDFKTYSLIHPAKEGNTHRIHLVTPFGDFTPEEQLVLSLEEMKEAIKEYYFSEHTEDFVKKIPCIDTTEEMKSMLN